MTSLFKHNWAHWVFLAIIGLVILAPIVYFGSDTFTRTILVIWG